MTILATLALIRMGHPEPKKMPIDDLEDFQNLWKMKTQNSHGRLCKQQRTALFTKVCAICERPCQYAFYGQVQCCEACKQFFRRTVVGRTKWFCPRSGNCKIAYDSGSGLERCQGCRLDKCLLVCLKWHLVQMEPHPEYDKFFAYLDGRKQKVLERKHRLSLLPMAHEESSDAVLLQHLMRLKTNFERIWRSYAELPYGYLGDLGCAEELVQCSENILGRAAEFSHNLSPFEYNFAQELREMGFLHPRMGKMAVVGHLLAVGLLKAMPAFSKLASYDQSLLARTLVLPIGAFWNSYKAAKNKMGYWCGEDGFHFEAVLQDPKFRVDRKLCSLIDRAHCRSIVPFSRTQIGTPEELVLLMAILCSHSAIPELSPSGREVLYAESARYSAMLLRLEQSQFGPVGGASRFAECLLLVESSFHSARNHELMLTYVEAFYYPSGFHSILPKFMKFKH